MYIQTLQVIVRTYVTFVTYVTYEISSLWASKPRFVIMNFFDRKYPDKGWGNPDGPLEQGKGTNKYLETYHTNYFFVLDGNTATGQINTIFFSTNRSTVTVRANLAWMKLSREIVEAHWKTHLSFMSWGTVQCFGGGRDRTNIEQFLSYPIWYNERDWAWFIPRIPGFPTWSTLFLSISLV